VQKLNSLTTSGRFNDNYLQIFFYLILVVFLAGKIFLLTSCKKEAQEELFTPAGTINDVDGNTYKVINVGSQLWMKENLKTTRYSDGSLIPNITDSASWLNLTSGAFVWYRNDEATYKNTYGALYNWYSVNDSRKLCPEGWHVPSDEEWTILENHVYNYLEYDGSEWIGVGGYMKEAGTIHWYSPNHGATNKSGFTALPAGCRYGPSYYTPEDLFINIGYTAYWWSSTDFSATDS
jgi:uncharacterized protein (TIGR02145 family)